jgi:hypothetical protein
MVRAITKLSPYLKNYPFCGGNGDAEKIMVLTTGVDCRNMLMRL